MELAILIIVSTILAVEIAVILGGFGKRGRVLLAKELVELLREEAKKP